MATQQDIARVAAELEAAEQTIHTLRRRRFISPDAGAAYSAAKGRVELATQELERLNAEWEAEQQALADRPQVEKAAGKEISAGLKRLEVSRQAVSEAATRAQEALTALSAAAGAHNALVEQEAAALTVRGLSLEEGYDHATGGARTGLRIRGGWWLPVEPSTLLVWTVHRAAAAALSGKHPLVAWLKWYQGRRDLDGRADGLLAAVPDLPPSAATAPLTRPEPAPLSVSYINSVSDAEQQLRKQLLGYTQLVQAADGTMYSKPCEAPEPVKEGVEQQIAKLREDVKSGRVVARRK